MRPGSELLGYRIERVLGRGGMGVVYLAQQLVLDRMVALKLLAPELAEDELFRARFLRESRLAASLDHPSIVSIFDAGEVEGRLYIAMRYVEGTDLARLLDEHAPLAPERAIALLGPVADALDAAQARGLVHRDVKPSNILVDESDRPYLADFGLSRETTERGLVESSHFAASADYVAPEQVARQPVGPAADIYALGCVLQECLTGAPPFRTGSLVATLFGHMNDSPPAASERNPRLPRAIDSVLAKALAKDPERRHSTCGELVADAEVALGLSGDSAGRARRRLAVVLALLAAASVAAFLVTRGGGSGALTLDSLVRIDPRTNRVAERVAAGQGVAGVTTGVGAIWVSSREDGAVWRIDARTLSTRKIPGFPEPGDVAVGRGNVYVGFRDGVGEIDAVNLNLSSATVGLGTSGQKPGVVAGPLGVWAADAIRPAISLLRLTPILGRTGVVDRIPIARVGNEARAFDTLTGIAEGENAVWVTGDPLEPVLFRIDPRSREITRIRLPSAPGKVAVGAGAVWVIGQLDDVVWRVDSNSHTITDTIKVGRLPSGVAVGAGAVWVASAIDGAVTRIDPTSRMAVATIEVGGLPQAIAAGAGGVWVATRAV